ncbi:Csu type fimbrial protein [Rosenbergiella collisarenosi]|uniref:Csu type fimbrial protein n=1 Tax=Rosenbergiella collisarenosi TaxID=1544695 RepID=UPI001BDAF272|nr:spore coat U domain-containing protein [Rosenbergiella collisarenosi]MBT0721204.1 spore coat protein U domain-containing protein [Rosenbergiella collisarenosi]
MKLRPFLFIIPLLSLSALPASAATEGTLSGQVGVQVIISEGCTVGNNTSSGTANEWGSINFGTYADLSNIINGTVLGSNGTDTVTVTCTSGLSPTLTLNGGGNQANQLRSMVSGSTTIPYRLYSDSSYSKEIPVNGSIALAADGTAQSIPLYGRILPGDQKSSAPTAGTYTDTVTATLSW